MHPLINPDEDLSMYYAGDGNETDDASRPNIVGQECGIAHQLWHTCRYQLLGY